MIGPDLDASDFFVAGGTLRADSPSYVERASDDELFNLARNGEFCYVLTARQMGKSSLMIRAARRLLTEGVHSVIIDLTKIGIEVTVDQWYLGLLTQLKRKLKLSVDLDAWWQEHTNIGYVQRFSDFLHDVMLQEIEGQVVIFMDEIDTTLNLAFSDDFFAAIRFIYNARATDSAFQRLTFVLLGVATPQDLIKDRNRTPFNIGQGIDLNDFSHQDAQVLQEGLIAAYPDEGTAIFNRIFFWTHGHPYLTQKLCLTVSEMNGEKWTDERVDQLVERLFLSKEARKETNLQFVRDSVENNPRRSRLLRLYRKVYTGKAMPEDKRSLDQTRLKLYGLVRVEDDLLAVRNRIYRRAFNLDWIRANMPVDWSRWVAVVSVAIILLLIGSFSFYVYYWQGARLAQSLTKTFLNTTSPNERITSLAGLFDLTGYSDEAEQLFYTELSPEERLNLFVQADPQMVGGELVTVVKGLYADLENKEADNDLLRAMVEPLGNVNDARASKLNTEIEQWLQGRNFYERGDYQQAVTVYNLVIELTNDRNPGIYFDRGLAFLELGEIGRALTDFEEVLKLNKELKTRIEQLLLSKPELYDAAVTGTNTYPELVAIVPSPTSTPSATPTWTPTPSPTVTPTETRVATGSATPGPGTDPTSQTPVDDTPTPIPTSTNTPLPSPTPTSTSTPTPRPANIVFVQSNNQTHDLGLVSSSGDLIEADLHRRAAAPAWSPDGTRVAFYGEPGISEFGGVYAQGSGLWIIEVQTRAVELLFQIDHILNIAWSPDGTKLAFEVGPPGVTHQVYIVDARDGREISRFDGEQPAWKPNNQELVIKSCAPECGLWQVGLDGSGGKLLTNDGTDSYPTWSPDANYLVFTSRARTGDWEIYRLRPSDGELVSLTERQGTDTTPVFSPDGLEIYLRTDAFGSWEVRAMAVDGRNERVVRGDVGYSDDWGRARPSVH